MTQDDVNELVGKRDDAARAMLAALKDAAGMVPVAPHLHPKDLAALQTSLCAAIAQAEAAGIKAP